MDVMAKCNWSATSYRFFVVPMSGRYKDKLRAPREFPIVCHQFYRRISTIALRLTLRDGYESLHCRFSAANV